MNAQELRNLQEAYAYVYNESMVGGRSLPSPSGGSSRPSLLDRVKSTVVDVGGKVGEAEAKRRNPSNIFGIPGRVGRNKGKETAGKAFDQATTGNVGGALNTVFSALNNSVDLFDIVMGHLIDEGYADTEEAALAIMANMSEEWRTSIIEEVDSQGNRSHDLFTDKPNPNYKPGNRKPKPSVKKQPPMRDEPLW